MDRSEDEVVDYEPPAIEELGLVEAVTLSVI